MTSLPELLSAKSGMGGYLLNRTTPLRPLRYWLLLLTMVACVEEEPAPPSVSREVAAPLLSAPGNILSNPGFEAAATLERVPPSWAHDGKLESTRGSAHTGTQNVLLGDLAPVAPPDPPIAPGWHSIDQVMTVQPNTRYRVGAWVRTSPDLNAAIIDVRAGANNPVVSHLQFGPCASGYCYQGLEFESGSATSAILLIGFSSTSSTSWMRVDDVSVIPNRLSDGGFEKTAGPALSAPWLADSMSTAVPSSARTGIRGVHLANTDTGWHAVNQFAAVRPNTTYVVQGWVRSSAGLSNIHVDIRGSDNSFITGVSPAGSTSWQRVSYSFNSGSNTSVLFYAGYLGSASGTFLDADDLSIFEADPPAVPAGAFTKSLASSAGLNCTSVCANGNTGPIGTCVGGYSDTGMGAPSVGCTTAPVNQAQTALTCYCQPKTFRETGQPSFLTRASTQHLGRLTNSTAMAAVGLQGTDNAPSFQTSHGRVFLFGDASTTAAGASVRTLDPVAIADAGISSVSRFNMPALSYFTQTNGSLFNPVTMPSVALGGGATPRDGLELNGQLFIFALDEAGNSVLGHTTNAWSASTKSWNVAQMGVDHQVKSRTLTVLNTLRKPGTNELYIFGTPGYAPVMYPSDPNLFLAKVDLSNSSNLTMRAAWTYYSGMQNGVPVFVTGEQNAAPLLSDPGVQEVSVRYHAATQQYIMLYMRNRSRGLQGELSFVFRTAPDPTGPWSNAKTVLDPYPDAYEVFMHASESFKGYDDGLYEKNDYFNPESSWGGEYAPYLTENWFYSESSGKAHHIVYTMSTAIPYQVHLIDTVLTEPGGVAPPLPSHPGIPLTNPTFSNGLTGWDVQTNGAQPVVYTSNGTRRLSTFTTQGDQTAVTIRQSFTVGTSTRHLTFSYCGGSDSNREAHGSSGNTRIKLIHNNVIVRSSVGRDTCGAYTAANWNLSNLVGETVTLVIEDSAPVGWWGYIDTSGFTHSP